VRFYGVPLRSSGVCAANVPDGQAMWETSQFAVGGGAVGHQHGLSRGRLAGGRADRQPRKVRDGLRSAADDPALLRRAATFATTEDDIAIDAIREVGPNGHYFGVQHTQDRYQTAFYAALRQRLAQLRGLAADGAVWTAERAHRIYKQILAEFEAARDGRRRIGRAGTVRRPAQAGRRGADRFLTLRPGTG
jgi:trimethylamine--corrinoid protein Co-methyltransferase